MPSSVDHRFLFQPPQSKAPTTSRKVHFHRLNDIFHLSLQRRDFQRARRAWGILARCKEFDWPSMWMSGLLLLRGDSPTRVPNEQLEFLRTMMLQNTREREAVLQELLFGLILRGEHRQALDQLELYLPAFPYHDNPILHTYAGLLSLYLAQPPPESVTSNFDSTLLRDAQSHLDQAKKLDPENVVATAFLVKIPLIEAGRRHPSSSQTIVESEEEIDDEYTSPRSKRTRV